MLVNEIEGKVMVDFVVDTLGRVVHVTSRDADNARIKPLVDEAIRVIKLSSNHWMPGMLNGRKTAVKMRIPITFKLEP